MRCLCRLQKKRIPIFMRNYVRPVRAQKQRWCKKNGPHGRFLRLHILVLQFVTTNAIALKYSPRVLQEPAVVLKRDPLEEVFLPPPVFVQ